MANGHGQVLAEKEARFLRNASRELWKRLQLDVALRIRRLSCRVSGRA